MCKVFVPHADHDPTSSHPVVNGGHRRLSSLFSCLSFQLPPYFVLADIYEMDSDAILVTAKRFFEAYNNLEINHLEEILSENVHWEHHNRFKGDGRDGLLRSIKDIAEKIPGRAFSEPKRCAVNGDTVFLEHSWHGVPAVDLPAFGWTKGVATSLDVCSVFVFSAGKIIDWGDYG